MPTIDSPPNKIAIFNNNNNNTKKWPNEYDKETEFSKNSMYEYECMNNDDSTYNLSHVHIQTYVGTYYA